MRTSFRLILFVFSLLSLRCMPGKQANADAPVNKTDCAACERIALFVKSKELVSNTIWNGLNTDAHTRPLLYFTDSSTYVAFGSAALFKKYNCVQLECANGLSLLKLPRIDAKPFHMENNMSFSDTASLFYNQPMMLCSDVEALLKMVPDFNKTEDWLQLVMHEYFHSYQFSHKPTMEYLADTIGMAADTLDKIYLRHSWFRELLEKENAALLNALRVTSNDSVKVYFDEFMQTRQQRRMKYEKISGFNLTQMENFWETIEGTARYAEYYMAGNFSKLQKSGPGQCDSLFRNFSDYTDALNFEDKPAFRERTKIMQAYYYVTGFNMCRLMDKMKIDYKPDLFNTPGTGLYELFVKNYQR